MCHVILCSQVEVIFVCHIPTVWHANNGQLNGVFLHSPGVLLLKEMQVYKTHVKQSPPLLCCISDLIAAIHCSRVSLLEYVFQCVNLRLSVFSVFICFYLFPNVYAFKHLLSTT